MIHEVRFSFTTEEARVSLEGMIDRMIPDRFLPSIQSDIQTAVDQLNGGSSPARQFMIAELIGSVFLGSEYNNSDWRRDPEWN